MDVYSAVVLAATSGMFAEAAAGCILGAAGTTAGGAAALLIKKDRKGLSEMLMGLSAGIMLAMVFLKMLPESFGMAGTDRALLGLGAGAAFVMLMRMGLNRRKQKSPIMRGLLFAIGIAVHNLPEGLAMGAGMDTPSLGMEMALLIVFHDVPEGIAMCVPLRQGGMSPGKVLAAAFAVGLPTSVGAVIGAFAGTTAETVSLTVAFGAGAMLALTLAEMLPDVIAAGKKAAMALAVGAAAGAAVILLI